MSVRATFWSGTYRTGRGKQLEDGDHFVDGRLLENDRILSALIAPRSYIQFGNRDRWSSVKWYGGLNGLAIQHASYLEQQFGIDSQEGRPIRIRCGAHDAPAIRMWRDDRYNNAHDVLTPRLQTEASGDGFGRPNWAMGCDVDGQQTVKLYRSSHGGPNDSAPLVLPPGSHRLPRGYSGYINAVSRSLDDWKLVKEEYDWKNRRVVESGETIGAHAEAVNNSGIDQEVPVTVTLEEGAAVEHNWNASVTVGASVEVSGGVKPFGIGADVTVSASVEATVGGGGSGTKDTRHSAEVGANATVPPHSKMDVAVIVRRETAWVRFVRTLRSKRDGSTIQETSESEVHLLLRGRVVFGQPQPVG